MVAHVTGLGQRTVGDYFPERVPRNGVGITDEKESRIRLVGKIMG